MNVRKVLILLLTACIILPGLALACTGSDTGQKVQPVPTQKFSGDKARGYGGHTGGAFNDHTNRPHDDLNLPADGNHPSPLSRAYEQWWNDTPKNDKTVNRDTGISVAYGYGDHGSPDAQTQGNVPSPLSTRNESWWTSQPKDAITANSTGADEARIAALEKQVAEQNQELERQGNILNQLMSLLARLFSWKP